MNQYLRTYRKVHVETASPGRLILMLYDGYFDSLNKAEAALSEKNVEKSHLHLIKAQDILSELMSSLRMDAGDMARNLLTLYDFALSLLVEANLKKDATLAREAAEILRPLRDAWEAAVVGKIE